MLKGMSDFHFSFWPYNSTVHVLLSVSQITLAFLPELQLNRMDTNEHFGPCWLAA